LLIQGSVTGAGLAAGGALLGSLGPADAASARRPGAAPVTITVLEHQALRLKLLGAEIPRFEALMAARGTPIRVKLLQGPTSDNTFQTQLTVAYTYGNGPDVTSFPVSWSPDFVLANFLKDITDDVGTWPDWQRYWYPAI